MTWQHMSQPAAVQCEAAVLRDGAVHGGQAAIFWQQFWHDASLQ
jgi:hypothetical protein